MILRECTSSILTTTKDVHQFELEKFSTSPNHRGLTSSSNLMEPGDRVVIAQGLTHGWSSYVEVYRPMFRVHPSFHEPRWTSSYGSDRLRKSPPIEQLDLSTVWKGLTMSEARELYCIEQVFEAHLGIMLVDKLSKSSSSDCSLQAPQSSDRSSHTQTSEFTSVYTVMIEIQHLILGMLKSLCYGGPSLNSYQSPEYWRDRVLCYLATCDCLMETEPPSLHHVIMRTRVCHPKSLEDEIIPPMIVEPAWNPDFLTFHDLDIAPRQGGELRIIPEYRSFAKSRVDASTVSISYSLGRLYPWLEWDKKLSGFRGAVPFYSHCKASDPILSEVLRGRHEDINVVDNLLRIEVVALWRKQLSPSVALEHTVRTRLNLKVLPCFPADKVDAAGNLCLSSVSQKEEAVTPLQPQRSPLPTGLGAPPVTRVPCINTSYVSWGVGANNLTGTPSGLAAALITTPVNPWSVSSEPLIARLCVEEYHLAVPCVPPPSTANNSTGSVREQVASLFDLNPRPSPAETTPLSRSNSQMECPAKSEIPGNQGVSTSLPSDPPIESEEVDRTMTDAIADTTSLYEEMDPRTSDFLEASHELCTIAQGYHYDSDLSNRGIDPEIPTQFSDPVTPPLVMRYYNRFAPLNDLRSQSDTLSIAEDGEDEDRFDIGSSTEDENDVLRSTPKGESGHRTDPSAPPSPSNARQNTSTETARLQHGPEVTYEYFLMSMDPALPSEERETARLVYDMLMTDHEEKRVSRNTEEPELTARLNAIIDCDGSNDGFNWTESETSGSAKDEERSSQYSSDGNLSLMGEEDEFGVVFNFGF